MLPMLLRNNYRLCAHSLRTPNTTWAEAVSRETLHFGTLSHSSVSAVEVTEAVSVCYVQGLAEDD